MLRPITWDSVKGAGVMSDRQFRVYSFVTACVTSASGDYDPAFWYEECACHAEDSAKVIRDLLAVRMPGITYRVSVGPPGDLADANVYDVYGNLVAEGKATLKLSSWDEAEAKHKGGWGATVR